MHKRFSKVDIPRTTIHVSCKSKVDRSSPVPGTTEKCKQKNITTQLSYSWHSRNLSGSDEQRCGSVTFRYGSGSCYFLQWPFRWQLKNVLFFLRFFFLTRERRLWAVSRIFTRFLVLQIFWGKKLATFLPTCSHIYGTIFFVLYGIFSNFSTYRQCLQLHLHHFSRMKSHKKAQNSRNQGFSSYSCLMLEWSGAWWSRIRTSY